MLNFACNPPHSLQRLSTTTDHSQQVSERRGDVWVTAAAFSSDHSVTRSFFCCLSRVLCLSMKERNKCLVLCSRRDRWQVSPGHLPSPGALPASECTRAFQDPPERIAPVERLVLVYASLWPTVIITPNTIASECLPERQSMIKSAPIFHGFTVPPPLSHLYHFTLYFLQDTSFPGGHCVIVF